MDDKYAPILLASFLTLIVTLVVQIAVVPWIQARTRRIERWETSLIELASLAEETLPRTVAEFQSAAQTELLHRMVQEDDDYRPELHRETRMQADASRRQADQALELHRRQIRVLINRLTHRHRYAPHWRQVQLSEMVMSWKLTSVTYLMIQDDLKNWDDPRWTEGWAEYEKAEKGFRTLIDKLTSTMRPPPQRLRKRAAERSKELLKRRRSKTSKATPLANENGTESTPAPSP